MVACLAAGGDVLSFGRCSLALQPLADIDDADERVWAHGWLMAVIRAQGVFEKTALSAAEVSAALQAALDVLAGEPRHRRTMTTLRMAVQYPDLKAAFADYAGSGPYAGMVDAAEDRISGADWVTFELTALTNKGPAVQPVLLALLHKVFQRLDGRPTLIPIDEAWLALRDMPGELDEWMRRLPKRNASVILATHALEDVADSRIAASLRENCKTKILLPNPRALDPAGLEILHRFGLNRQQAVLIAGGVPKRDLYVVRPDGARLAHLHLGPIARALCAAGGAEDAKLSSALLATHGKAGFVAAWLRAKGLPEAADQLEEASHAMAADESRSGGYRLGERSAF